MSLGREAVRIDPKGLVDESLTEQIIGAAIEVHRHLVPGLLESNEECLPHELRLRGLTFKRQAICPWFTSVALDCGYKIDLVVKDRVVIELKGVEAVLGVHHATTAYLPKAERKTSRTSPQFSCLSDDERHCPSSAMTLTSISPFLRVSVAKFQ